MLVCSIRHRKATGLYAQHGIYDVMLFISFYESNAIVHGAVLCGTFVCPCVMFTVLHQRVVVMIDDT